MKYDYQVTKCSHKKCGVFQCNMAASYLPINSYLMEASFINGSTSLRNTFSEFADPPMGLRNTIIDFGRLGTKKYNKI